MAGHTKYGKPTELKDGALALSKKGTIRFTSYYDSSEVKENADLLINIIKDPKTGITDVVHLCFECDPDLYPRGKPIINDPGATKDEKGNWVCSSCQEESLNKMFLRTLGPQHPKCQSFIKAEDKRVRKHNDAARRLNEVSGQYLMKYRRNKYTGSMPLSTGQLLEL